MPVDYEIQNRVAIITGASSGMGLAVAKGLAQQGVNLILVARNKNRLSLARKEILSRSAVEVEIIAGNVTEQNLPKKTIQIALQKWGTVDILVNNAGGPPMGSFLDQTEETWEVAIDQNLKSVIRFTKAIAPLMIKQKWGRILNITSTLAKEPTPAMVLSATARAGVSAFSKAISFELAPHTVTINTLCPGGVLTERLTSLVQVAAEKNNKDFEKELRDSCAKIPIGRFAEPEEFADTLVFLASERGRYITGTTIMVDGGLTRGVF